MSIDLNSVLNQIGRDKGIDKAILIEAVESAVLSAARKHFGHNLNLEAKFNEDTGEVEIVEFKAVVEEVVDLGTQINLETARRDYDPDAQIGDEFGRKLETSELGRIAAQTAKQVILQKVRDAERGVIFQEYKNSKGEIINGIVQRYEKGNLFVNLGRTEAILPKREQIQREKYRQGDRIRGMILDIDPSNRGPQIVLTRSHPEFLRKLFTSEVPEIGEGIIEIKSVAREPGERSKIAVYTNDPSVDPVGACVGIKGSRVQAVVQELKGERVDIVTWTQDEPSFVARSLSPAEVSRVVVDEDNHSMEVIVGDEHLSLAIGRKGQNVKLASKLSGWRIDVRSLSAVEEESKKARAAIESIPGVQFTDAELLFQQGYRGAKDIAEASLEDLMEIEGFTEEKANQIIDQARLLADKLAAEGNPEWENDEAGSDLKKLGLDQALREKLFKAGFKSIQSLAITDDALLLSVDGVGELELSRIRDSLDVFLKSGILSKREERV